MLAYLVTGKTYPLRRELRAAGGVWNKDEQGYVFKAAPKEFAGCSVSEIEIDEKAFEPLSPDELRAYRQDKKDRYAARLETQAENAEKRAEQASNRVSPYERDFLSLGEPIKVGHHSEGRHRNLINRVRGAWDAEMTERKKAAELRQKASWLTPAHVKGDTARARQELREEISAQIGKGDRVNDIILGVGIVLKVNAKTFTVAFERTKGERSFTFAVDKTHVRLLAKGTEADIPARKFKKGDQVTTAWLQARYEGTIVRLTPKGYSVEYVAYGKTKREVFQESQISLR